MTITVVLYTKPKTKTNDDSFSTHCHLTRFTGPRGNKINLFSHVPEHNPPAPLEAIICKQSPS
jgi:hypothetical protein